MLPAPAPRLGPGRQPQARLTWQHTRKMKRVMAVQSTFSLGCGPPPSPRCLPAGPAGEDTNRGRKRGETQEATFLLLPHPSLPCALL